MTKSRRHSIDSENSLNGMQASRTVSGLRRLVRSALPFPLRLWIAEIRLIGSVKELFGRSFVRGWHASIASDVTARCWRHVQVGHESIVDPGTHFHSNDDGEGLRIRIGMRCFIGRHCYFSAGEIIEIGDDCNIGAACHLLAAGHVYDCPRVPYSAAPVVSYGRMRLGPNTWLGVGTTLVGDVSIGFGSVIAAGSLVRTSLPPLCLAGGQPATVIKVFDWPSQSWVRLPGDEPERAAALERHIATIPSEAAYARVLSDLRNDRERYA